LGTRGMPEERELEAKRAALAVLQTQLVQRELEMATLLARVRTFEQRYLRTVGTRYAELDRIHAETADVRAKLESHDIRSAQYAQEAWQRAEQSRKATEHGHDLPDPRPFEPNESLKKIYRETAKRVHPDLATDGDERALRTRVMAEVNQAYEGGDEARLRAILEEWEARPEAVPGETVGAELVRTIRRLAQVQSRLATIDRELEGVLAGELHRVMVAAEELSVEGRDLLGEMALQLDQQIAEAHQRLTETRAGA
jgi:hypothetical protein